MPTIRRWVFCARTNVKEKSGLGSAFPYDHGADPVKWPLRRVKTLRQASHDRSIRRVMTLDAVSVQNGLCKNFGSVR